MKIFGKYGKMKINEFIKNNLKVTNLAKSSDPLMNHMLTSTRLPQIVCSDGFKMSVQVGYSLYSEPKKVAKRYSKVEIGFPSEREPLLEEYVELGIFDLQSNDEKFVDYTDTVYPYVPVKVVNQVLKKHGGIDLTKTKHQKKVVEKVS